MLPLRRSELTITLSPQQLLLDNGREPLMLSCLPSSDTAWSAPMAVLENLIKQVPWDRGNVTLILSNHFVRYMVVPWNDMLLRPNEQKPYLQHLFNETYGELASRFELRLNPASPGKARLACAIDRTLLERLRGLLDQKPLHLISLQPWLMHHFNSQRRHIGRAGGWFVTVEHGIIGILGCRDSDWRIARTIRCGQHWPQELRTALERLYLCGDAEGIPKAVHCGSHDGQMITLPGDWHVTQIAMTSLVTNHTTMSLAAG